jgi:hypothetical protein
VTGFNRLMGCFINVTCFEYYMMNIQSIICIASIKGDHVMSNNFSCYTTFLVSDKEKLFCLHVKRVFDVRHIIASSGFGCTYVFIENMSPFQCIQLLNIKIISLYR